MRKKQIIPIPDELFSVIQKKAASAPEKDKWLEKTAGSYATGKRNILAELWRGNNRFSKR
jgi:hypothetical protein